MNENILVFITLKIGLVSIILENNFNFMISFFFFILMYKKALKFKEF